MPHNCRDIANSRPPEGFWICSVRRVAVYADGEALMGCYVTGADELDRSDVSESESLLADARAKPFYPIEALFNIRHTCRVAEADAIVRSKRNSRNRCHLFRLKQFRAKLARFENR